MRDFIMIIAVPRENHEKTNSMDSALCIDQAQPMQSAQANPGQHIPSQGNRGTE